MYPKSNYTIKIDDMTPEDPDSIKYVQDENNRVKYQDCGVDQYGLNPRLMSLTDYFSGNLHHTHHVFYNTNNVLARQGKKTESRTFIDLKVIKVRSGNGGNGCVSYFRDANRPSGPPDGGDGGDGGDVYISVAEKNMSSLHKVKRTYEAKHGTTGKGSQLDGKSGEDIVIEVPVGTTIRWIPDPAVLKKFLRQREGKDLDDIKMELRCDEYDHIQLVRPGYEPGSGWSFKEGDKEYYEGRPFFQELNKKVMEYDRELVQEELKFDKFPLLGLDLSRPSKKPMLLLKGGKGGMGNMHFLTKDIRNPNFSKKGRDGIQTHFLLELKLIADLGLVGLPNAGKSTLLRAISRARPRVGHWEFTTLQPTVGTIFTTIDKDPFTVADIPGIIKGASENKGMGLDFLRHIERSGGLVFVVSLESENPVADLEVLLNEVGSKRMKDKEVLVVATKADLTDDGANYKILRDYVEAENGWKIVPVCAMKGQNIEKCIKLMGEIAYSKNAKLM
ncbi:hypothetical protein G9P44_000281 [Scheffersomyces stipitis]|nr:hypothetical protein G9P44_000281 [Scheffersomyces stipitis]